MVNGLGVLGWGVGGIEAEAAMLGQPMSMLIPQVLGFELHGELPRGRDRDRPRAHRHRDAAQARRRRQVRRVLRRRRWRGCRWPIAPRSATCRPSSAPPARSSRSTPRRCATWRSPAGPPEQIELVEAYAKAQGLWHDERREQPTFSETLELDLAEVVPSIAGPKRPQDRISLSDAQHAYRRALGDYVRPNGATRPTESSLERSAR